MFSSRSPLVRRFYLLQVVHLLLCPVLASWIIRPQSFLGAPRLLTAFRQFVILPAIAVLHPVAPRLFAIFCVFHRSPSNHRIMLPTPLPVRSSFLTWSRCYDSNSILSLGGSLSAWWTYWFSILLWGGEDCSQQLARSRYVNLTRTTPMPRWIAALGGARQRAPFGRLLGICRRSGRRPNQQFDSVYGIENPGGCTNWKTSKENADGKGGRWSHPQPLRPMPPANISPQGLEQQEIYYRIMPLHTQNASLQDKQQDLNNNSKRNLLTHLFPVRSGRNINAA